MQHDYSMIDMASVAICRILVIGQSLSNSSGMKARYQGLKVGIHVVNCTSSSGGNVRDLLNTGAVWVRRL